MAWIASLDPTIPEPADLVRQSGDTDCGPAVLMMVLDHYGLGQLTPENFETTMPVGPAGTNMLKIKQIAETYGLRGQGLRLSVERLPELRMPVVAHVFDNHFVLLRSASDDFVVDDPSVGRLRMSPETFDRAWDGIVLTLDPIVRQENVHQKGAEMP